MQGIGAPTLSDDAYERLRAAIVRGEIRPNERLIETELAERLQISRTPIREGLQRLALDGLVLSRRRGWVVREHTAAEIAELYEVRAGLEGLAGRLAVARATDEELDRVAEIHRDAGVDTAGSPREHLADVNAAFHDAILAAAGNPRLGSLVRASRDHFFNHRTAALHSDAESAASIAGHARIVAALLARDADAADAALREHVLEALAVTLSKLG
jgi:DNA-binding GntR family transcriptional regulator